MVCEVGATVMSGASFNNNTRDGIHVTTNPQASVTVGGGMEMELVVSQIRGQPGTVRVSIGCCAPVEQPLVKVPMVTGFTIQGCVSVKGGIP